MARLQKLEGQVELNCSADLLFEIVTAKTPNITEICAHHVSKIHAHHEDWVTPGTTRQWHCKIDGKDHPLTERIEKVDEENKIILRKVIEGDLLQHYTSLTNNIQVIPKGDDSCIMVYTLEYGKVSENEPEPRKLLDFALNLFKELGGHLRQQAN